MVLLVETLVCCKTHQSIGTFTSYYNLQNPTDKRQIICDDKLKAIMGGNATVTMFNMNRYITDHLLEKLDRSAYVHEEEVEAEPVDDDDDEDGNGEEEDDDEEEVEEDVEADVEDEDDDV